mmetsp:Transcript_33091/g.104116  ORF Transcript_33091/g.104116 Transcript_33091/m.104116 type:complete len:377 (-) Transcript_33091:511-1641(-)
MELDAASYGVRYPRGGFGRVRRRLLEQCEKVGVRVRTGVAVTRVEVSQEAGEAGESGAAATGVRIVDGDGSESSFAADIVRAPSRNCARDRQPRLRPGSEPPRGEGVWGGPKTSSPPRLLCLCSRLRLPRVLCNKGREERRTEREEREGNRRVLRPPEGALQRGLARRGGGAAAATPLQGGQAAVRRLLLLRAVPLLCPRRAVCRRARAPHHRVCRGLGPGAVGVALWRPPDLELPARGRSPPLGPRTLLRALPDENRPDRRARRMRRHHGSPPDAAAAGRRLRGGGGGAVRRVGGGGAGVCRRAAGPLAWHGRLAAEHPPRVRHPAGSVAARVRPRSRRRVWPRLQPQPALLPPARPAPPSGAQPLLCRRLRAAR